MAKLPVFSAPQTSATSGFTWFVYGSSLDFFALAAWCKDHGYVVPDLTMAKPATLAGWKLAFNVRSNFWGGAVASLVEDPNSSVEGVAIPLPAEALGFVRHKEGVLSGLFEEKKQDGMQFYVAAPSRIVAEEKPAERFLDTIVSGAKARGLSKEWVAKLEAMR